MTLPLCDSVRVSPIADENDIERETPPLFTKAV